MSNGGRVKLSAWMFLIGCSTMYKIIPEVFQAICDCLQKNYVKFPQTEEEWLEIADGFLKEFDLPHCVGSVDSKKCTVNNPPNSGVRFKNYKKASSIGLLATCDAYRRFTWAAIVLIGTNLNNFFIQDLSMIHRYF